MMLSHQLHFHLSLPLLLITSSLSAALPKPATEDNGGQGVIPGSIDDTGSGDKAGASGAPGGSVNLSKSAQIAIIIVVTVVVVFGVTSAILFYLAKKRQWEMRAKIRRSARRVTASLKSPGLRSPMSFRSPMSHRPQSANPRTPAGEAALAASFRDRHPEPPRRPAKVGYSSSNLKNYSRHQEDGRVGDVEKGIKLKSYVAIKEDEKVPSREEGWSFKKLNPFGQHKG